MTKNITVHVTPDYQSMSQMAAKLFAQTVSQNPKAVYGFATGGTPEGMYQDLVKMSQAGTVNISEITAFNLDEYTPLSPSNPQSYAHYRATKLFDHVGIPQSRRNIPKGDAPCPTAEAAAYETKIISAGGIHLQILGIGTNGHIGFNEPADTFPGPTAHVALTQSTIDANARYFNNITDVPKHAISMGMQSIMMAKSILLLASGSTKAKILSQALTGPITPQVPASVLQLHQNVTVIVDKPAAAFLS